MKKIWLYFTNVPIMVRLAISAVALIVGFAVLDKAFVPVLLFFAVLSGGYFLYRYIRERYMAVSEKAGVQDDDEGKQRSVTDSVSVLSERVSEMNQKDSTVNAVMIDATEEQTVEDFQREGGVHVDDSQGYSFSSDASLEEIKEEEQQNEDGEKERETGKEDECGPESVRNYGKTPWDYFSGGAFVTPLVYLLLVILVISYVITDGAIMDGLGWEADLKRDFLLVLSFVLIHLAFSLLKRALKAFLYLVRKKPHCVYCGKGPVHFLGKMQGAWFIPYGKKAVSPSDETNSKFCKAGYESFWECSTCRAISRCWHSPSLVPSEYRKILKIELARSGHGLRLAQDWEKRGLDAMRGERNTDV